MPSINMCMFYKHAKYHRVARAIRSRASRKQNEKHYTRKCYGVTKPITNNHNFAYIALIRCSYCFALYAYCIHQVVSRFCW